MTINDYQQAALRTANPNLTPIEMLQEGLMGLNGEAGECIDILKKHLFQGHELDRMELGLELGDAMWYLAVSAWALGYDLETIMEMNIRKLEGRYPDGFSAERSVNRVEGRAITLEEIKSQEHQHHEHTEWFRVDGITLRCYNCEHLSESSYCCNPFSDHVGDVVEATGGCPCWEAKIVNLLDSLDEEGD